MVGLIAFYKNKIRTLNSDSNNLHILKNCLSNADLDEAKTLFILKESKEFSEKSPDDFLSSLRTLLAVLIAKNLTENRSEKVHREAKSVFEAILSKRFWKEFHLGTALSYLISYFLDGGLNPITSKKQLKIDFLLERKGNALDGGVPHAQHDAELALIWMCLGHLQKDNKLITDGLNMAYFLRNLFDHEGNPLLGVWLQESVFSPTYFFPLYSLLFSVSAQFCLDSKMISLSERLLKKLDHFSLKGISDNDFFIPILASFLQKDLFKKPIEAKERDVSLTNIDRSLGFLRYTYKELSLVCSASGVNTGLGAVHKNGLEIVSFGPHVSHLSEPDGFGIYRTCSGSEEGFKDLLLKSQEESCHFKGWSRLVCRDLFVKKNQNFTSARPGKQWVFFDIQADKETVVLDISFSSDPKLLPLFFVFFVRAQRANVFQKQRFLPGELNQFHGKSCEVTFESMDKQLSINPMFESKMSLIPLGNKQHFWSATFLLAFPIKEKLKHYMWSIE